MKNLTTLYLILLLTSCEPIPCSVLEYNNGITTKNGKLFSGECNTFFDDFNLRSIQKYKNGEDNGNWTFYYNNGNIQTQGSFNRGSREGEWKYFYESGNIWKINFYKNNKKIGMWKTFDEIGNLIEATQFN